MVDPYLIEKIYDKFFRVRTHTCILQAQVVKNMDLHHMGIDVTKPVLGVSDKAGLKLVSSATETGQKIEIWLVASLDMILSNS